MAMVIEELEGGITKVILDGKLDIAGAAAGGHEDECDRRQP